MPLKQKIQIIQDDGIRNQFESKEYINNYESEIIELIILKEIQNDIKEKFKLDFNNYNRKIKEKIKEHKKKEKQAEVISDRILGNLNNINTDNNIIMEDIMNLGKFLKEEIDLGKNYNLNTDNIIDDQELNMYNQNNNNYVLSALYKTLTNIGIKTAIEKKK